MATDFEGMTAERFLETVPFDEDARYEWKADLIIENKQRFDMELGKQVSAFANSSGGYIVLGVANDRSLRMLSTERKRPTLKEWLVGKVNRSVDYPIKDFSVHVLPSALEENKAVAVIEVAESLAAPHMAVDEKRYYYRLDGRSEIAPHYYLDLLRNRSTKAKLTLTVYRRTFYVQDQQPTLCLHVELINESHQCAERWGIILKASNDAGQHFKVNGRSLHQGALAPHSLTSPPLMPLHNESFAIEVKSRMSNPGREVTWADRWRTFGIDLIPVSQNYAGTPIRIEWTDGDELQKKVFDLFGGLVNPTTRALDF